MDKTRKAKFTPSLGKPVKLLDKDGKVVQTVYMNRKERRRLGIKKLSL